MRWLALLCLVGFAAPAGAAPFASVQWNSCSDAAPRNLDYAGPGTVNQVVLLHGFAGTVTGVSFEIEVRSPSGFPDAWRFDAAGCNAGAATFSLAAFGKSCPSVGSGFPVSANYTWDPATGQAHARLVGVISGPVTLDSTKTYVLGRVAYDQGACAGTGTPMCFELLSASVTDAGGNERPLALGNANLTWQDPQQQLACAPNRFRGAQVDEIFTSCLGDTVPQFVELRSTGDHDLYTSAMHLRVLGHDGGVRFDGGNLFGAALEGTSWPNGRAWLCATRGFELQVGLAADFRLPAVLDPLGGRIEVYEPNSGNPAHGVEYGPATANPLPPPGEGLVRQANGSYAAAYPSPEKAAGTIRPFACPSIVIREVAQACTDGSRSGRFLELEALGDAIFDHGIRLQAGNAGEVDLFPAMADGTPWPQGKKWLIASTAVGVAVDRQTALDLGQVLKLFAPNGALLDSLNWGDVPTLPWGYSVERQSDRSWRLNPAPTPTNFAGQSGAGTACYCPGPNCADSTMSRIRVDEFATRCLNGEAGSQYIVLRAMGPGQQFHTKASLRTSDVNLQNGKIVNPFENIAEGTPWPEGKAFLLAAPNFGYASSVAPDRTIDTILDPGSGGIQLFDTRNGGTLVDIVRYGPGQPVRTPDRGESVRRAPDGTPFIAAAQTPQNFAGNQAAIDMCPCGIRLVDWNTFQPDMPAPLYVRFDTTVTATNGRTYASHYEYDASLGFQAASDSGMGFARSGGVVGTVFTLNGPIPGQEVTLTATLHVTGNSSGTCNPGCSRGTGTAALVVPGNQVSQSLGGPTDVTLSLPFTIKVGEPWRLDTRLRADVVSTVQPPEGPYIATFRSQLAILNVPPGMMVQSCAGFRSDGPTAARPALVASRREDGDIHLEWSASDAVSEPRVERTEDGATWLALGTPARIGSLWTYDDPTAQTDVRYGYRLAWVGDASEPVWIEVGKPVLALRALTANPGRAPQLEFTLPAPARVRFELLDLRGRRVMVRDLGAQEAGAHRIEPAASLRAGVYWARLLVGDDEKRLKLIVL